VGDDTVFLRVWRMVARVPRGHVATYGQIARMAGLHRGARTVGWALRAVPDDARVGGRRVPWHRVINAQGGISLRGGPGEVEVGRQAAALRREGVAVSAGGRIDLGRYLWRGERRRP
jgi:methylated-DNA-protein-cysteine methyltransferase-like protein